MRKAVTSLFNWLEGDLMKALKLRLNSAWNWLLMAGYYACRFIFVKADLLYISFTDVWEFSKNILQFDEFNAVE